MKKQRKRLLAMGIALAVATMAGCGTNSQDPLDDEKVDMVVVGSGGAGLAATVTAAEGGLNVILVEQLGVLGGASARAGGPSGADTKVLEKYGMEFSQEDYYSYLSAPVGDNLDPALQDLEYTQQLSVRAGENIDWLYDMGP